MGCNLFVTAIRETTIQLLYNHAVHSDGKGQTWQPTTSIWYDITAPACNDDLIRYTSENQGHDKNRLLHSVPYRNNCDKFTNSVQFVKSVSDNGILEVRLYVSSLGVGAYFVEGTDVSGVKRIGRF